MPRNMSFMLTKEQVKNQTKTVTRRLGWWFLRGDEILNAVEQCQGLKKGEKIVRINLIQVVDTRPERLYEIDKIDCIAEGFPDLTPDQFIEMFCKSHRGCQPETMVNRIRFEYICAGCGMDVTGTGYKEFGCWSCGYEP